jgi:hypothetical protein
VADDTPTNAKVTLVREIWHRYSSISFLFGYLADLFILELGNLNGVPGIKSGGNFYNKHCFIYYFKALLRIRINADPDLDPSFHFNTDPDQTFSNSVQIRTRILLHINVMRVCDYCSKDLPFLFLHASIVSQVVHDPCKNFS